MMKMAIVVALAASPLAAAVAEPLPEKPAQQIGLEDGMAPEPRVDSSAELPEAGTAPRDETRKKRKSTDDKILTGAAVILGVGALAVGGLLVTIFVG